MKLDESLLNELLLNESLLAAARCLYENTCLIILMPDQKKYMQIVILPIEPPIDKFLM
jgi:hypothetical protein